MAMMVISNHDISISKGEPGSFDVQYTSEPPGDGTKIVFTVKKCVNEKEPLIEKTMEVDNGKITVELEGTDTELPPGDYVWDLVEEDGYRPILPATFSITSVVGNKGAVMI